MGSHAALIAELEQEKEGSRALSDEVLRALGWITVVVGGHEIWNSPDGKLRLAAQFDRPDPTQNLQDAADEAERCSYDWEVGKWIQSAGKIVGDAQVWPSGDDDALPTGGKAWSPALALSAAILKAMETEGG